MSDENVIEIANTEPKKKKSKDTKMFVDLNAALQKMNQRYAAVKIGETMRIADFSEKEISYLKKNDFMTFSGNWFVTVQDEDEGKAKKVQVAKKWLEWPGRRTYEKMVFKPTTDPLPENTYNLWQGWAVKPKKGAGKFDLFFDHIRVNICGGDEEIFRWVIGWLCDLFQNPCNKIGVALVLRSPEEGTGKGFFANQIGHLIGRHFATYLHSERIVGKFNAHLRDKLLIFMDEAMWAGDKQARGVLYGLITEPTITVEAKGMMPEESPSFLRVLMASNHDWVAPAGPTARRFCVLDVADNSQNNQAYFKEIHEELKNGGYEALLDYFLTTPYDYNFVRMPIKTEALLDQKISGLENETAWFFECLNYRRIGNTEFANGFIESSINSNDLYDAYLNWATKNSVKKPCARSILTRNLNKSCGLKKHGVALESKWAGGTMGNFYNLKTVEAYREAFELKFGQAIQWEE